MGFEEVESRDEFPLDPAVRAEKQGVDRHSDRLGNLRPSVAPREEKRAGRIAPTGQKAQPLLRGHGATLGPRASVRKLSILRAGLHLSPAASLHPGFPCGQDPRFLGHREGLGFPDHRLMTMDGCHLIAPPATLALVPDGSLPSNPVTPSGQTSSGLSPVPVRGGGPRPLTADPTPHTGSSWLL